MGKSLYRSYRSTSFDEILGQDHIVQVLKNSIANHALSHAYLLSGPRGTGKTSVARILAYAANDQDYRSEETNLDIIEIDAASNRRIDEIREIKERVHIAPLAGKYKIYIVDEVHMLTKEAFNALLKTLEEPPSHVIFILATTEFHKVPETIVSRCVRLTFKPISEDVILGHLSGIATKENISIDQDALKIIAKHGRGSFRDAISLLDQVKGLEGDITTDIVNAMLGLTSTETCENILAATVSGNLTEIHRLLNEAIDSGIQAGSLASQLSEVIRVKITSPQSTMDLPANLELLEKLLDVPGSLKPQVALELALYSHAVHSIEPVAHEQEARPTNPHVENTGRHEVHKTNRSKPNQPASSPTEIMVDEPKTKTSPPDPKGSSDQTTDEPKVSNSIPSSDPNGSFDEFLKELKKHNNTLYGVARMAKSSLNDNKLTLTFKFAFHFKQLTDTKNLGVVSGVVKQVYGESTELSVTMEEKEKPATNIEESLDTVANIFGGHEVLEG